MSRFYVAERSTLAALLCGTVTFVDCDWYAFDERCIDDEAFKLLFVALRDLGPGAGDEAIAAFVSERGGDGAGVAGELEQLRREGALERDELLAREDVAKPCAFEDCGSEAGVLAGICCLCERPQLASLAHVANAELLHRRAA